MALVRGSPAAWIAASLHGAAGVALALAPMSGCRQSRELVPVDGLPSAAPVADFGTIPTGTHAQ